MAKSLLILMLLTTQILAGSGGSLYLCIKNDGSGFCFDTDIAACTCCHKEVTKQIACVGCGCESAESCRELEEQEACKAKHHGLLASEPCGCTHIPVMVSGEQATTVARTLVTTESERLTLLLAWLPSSSIVDQLAESDPPRWRWNGPPAIPDFALSVVATTVIRC